MTSLTTSEGINVRIKTSPGGYIEAESKELKLKYMANIGYDTDALQFVEAKFTDSFKHLNLQCIDASGHSVSLKLLIETLYKFIYERHIGAQRHNADATLLMQVEMMTMMQCMQITQNVFQARLEKRFDQLEKRLDSLEKAADK